MIVYQAPFDLYHAVFRLSKLLGHTKIHPVEIDRLRIWDFFLMFPDRMEIIRLKANEGDVKKLIRNYIVTKAPNKYEVILNDTKMFERMRPYQMAALKCLAALDVIDSLELDNGNVQVMDWSKLLELASVPADARHQNAVNLLTSHFALMPLNGSMGLKQRTGLIESKYDV